MLNSEAITLRLFSLAITMLSGASGAQTNYEDCLIEGLKGVSSDRAADLIKEACQGKFSEHRSDDPKESPVPVSLPEAALRALDITMSVYPDTAVAKGTLSNRSEWTVIATQIHVEHSGVGSGKASKMYTLTTEIKPYSSGEFEISGIVQHWDRGAEYYVGIVSAIGYKEQK